MHHMYRRSVIIILQGRVPSDGLSTSQLEVVLRWWLRHFYPGMPERRPSHTMTDTTVDALFPTFDIVSLLHLYLCSSIIEDLPRLIKMEDVYENQDLFI